MCKSCNAIRINNVLCHEHGCPDAWKSVKRECKWCGSMFTPEHARQEFCEDSCFCAYNGIPDEVYDFIMEE